MTKSCKQFRHLFNLKNHDIVIAYLLLAAEPKPLWSFLASFLIFADHQKTGQGLVYHKDYGSAANCLYKKYDEIVMPIKKKTRDILNVNEKNMKKIP